MNDLRQAAEMALKVLEEINESLPYPLGSLRYRLSKPPMGLPLPAEIDGAMETLRQALAERDWVGLTDEERADCWSSSAVQSAINIEQALKDRNT